MTDIPLTISSLHQAYQSGTSPAQIVEQVFAKIETVGDPNIFLYLFDKSEVLAAANALGDFDPSKPLWGVPFAIKDNIDAAGKPTTAACPAYEYTAEADAFVVDQLLQAGALLIGKTNLDQFATGLVGVRTPYGAPLNSIDPQIVPGGSSGGSGVAVGHGIVSFSLGTDTAGSGRVPAALNNIVGLKPSLGSLSATGLVPACRSLDTISVFALTVEDAYAAFQAAAAYDPADSYARKFDVPDLTSPAAKMTIGIPSPQTIQFFGDTVQQAAFDDTVQTLKSMGYTIEEVDFSPLYAVAEMLYYGAWVAERYVVIEDLLKTNPDAVFPVTRQIISAGESLSAGDAFKGIYRLKELIRQAEPALSGLDMLCVPTIPTFYSVADLEADPVTPNSNFGTYTNFVNLMDMCGIAVPTPARSDGRPGSVTLLAPAGQDATVAALATRIEAMGQRRLGATDWSLTPADLPAAQTPDMIRIAVCGAHMAGLPLNTQLTERGAVLKQATTTAPDYQFYALPGDIPRPGLIRVAAGTGHEIAVEVWQMPLAEFGSFMRLIPAPLGIGSVTLAGGDIVNGFICEGAAAETATDISGFGSWRAYLASNP
ncbi:allophanate hydrolase [Thalassovita sp.]|uniref:allophanate hydrolase n=1 Tax=Thalassovita sp. TaxID=1979401 RepID=UPI003B58BF6C